MKSEERLWELIVKKDSGEITPEQLKELEYLLEQNEVVKTAYSFMEEIYRKGISEVDKANRAARWKAIQQKIHLKEDTPEKKQRHFIKRLTIAAACVLLVATGIFYVLVISSKTNLNTEGSKKNQVSTLLGSRTKIILPDGTKVWLNSGSKLTYENFDSAPVRAVTLSGEAFFEVVHNIQRPFIVHTKMIDVKDVGTSFVIKAYPDDNTFEATLIEGAIQVINQKDSERQILLKPKEKIIIPLPDSLQEKKFIENNDSDPVMLYKIDKVKKDNHGLLPETAWTENKLVFNNEAFGVLAKRMERWYNIKIYFKDSLIEQTPFSGIIENETLEQALKAMQFSKPFIYKMEGNKVWIYKN